MWTQLLLKMLEKLFGRQGKISHSRYKHHTSFMETCFYPPIALWFLLSNWFSSFRSVNPTQDKFFVLVMNALPSFQIRLLIATFLQKQHCSKLQQMMMTLTQIKTYGCVLILVVKEQLNCLKLKATSFWPNPLKIVRTWGWTLLPYHMQLIAEVDIIFAGNAEVKRILL